jgi:hypothetical protein
MQAQAVKLTASRTLPQFNVTLRPELQIIGASDSKSAGGADSPCPGARQAGRAAAPGGRRQRPGELAGHYESL